jgi:hypothetical protein
MGMWDEPIKNDLTQNKIKIFMYLHLTTYFPNLPSYLSTYLPTQVGIWPR